MIFLFSLVRLSFGRYFYRFYRFDRRRNLVIDNSGNIWPLRRFVFARAVGYTGKEKLFLNAKQTD